MILITRSTLDKFTLLLPPASGIHFFRICGSRFARSQYQDAKNLSLELYCLVLLSLFFRSMGSLGFTPWLQLLSVYDCS